MATGAAPPATTTGASPMTTTSAAQAATRVASPAPNEGEENPSNNPNDKTKVASSTDQETRTTSTLPADLTDKMNKLRDTLCSARGRISTQQNNLSQLNNDLAKALQSRIPADQTEFHSIIDTIRQNYEIEINDFKQILQLFDNSDNNEQMKEILRLRKRIDEFLANKPSTTTTTATATTGASSTISKSSEDVAPKRVQPFTTTQNQEAVISRVVPMAPATGRQIGVATPMTASSASTTGASSFGTVPIVEATNSQTITSVEHPMTGTTTVTTSTTGSTSATASTSITTGGPQLMTPAGINLLQKRSRPDDNDTKSSESALKRTKPETETTPLIAHVEPQVREQQPIAGQEQAGIVESNLGGQTRNEILVTPNEVDTSGPVIGETLSTERESEARPSSSTATTITTTTATTTTTTNVPTETTAVVEPATTIQTEPSNEQRRNDFAPIVYDVRHIPAVVGVPNMPPRGMNIRTRAFVSGPSNRRPWGGRGPGGGRGGFGGRGGGSLGGTGP